MKHKINAICSRLCKPGFIMSIILLSLAVNAAPVNGIRITVDKARNKVWNNFADRIYKLHQSLLKTHEIRKETSQGGFARQPDLYTETRYYDKSHDHLLSRIQRLNKNPDLILSIEVYIYNASGKLVRDYAAAYLPEYRNAPIQTLINLHTYHDSLHGFRQFDASGERIYEQCQGSFRGKPVMISLDEDEFSSGPDQETKTLNSTEYKKCFAGLPLHADKYLNPLHELTKMRKQGMAPVEDSADLARCLIEQFSNNLQQQLC